MRRSWVDLRRLKVELEMPQSTGRRDYPCQEAIEGRAIRKIMYKLYGHTPFTSMTQDLISEYGALWDR